MVPHYLQAVLLASFMVIASAVTDGTSLVQLTHEIARFPQPPTALGNGSSMTQGAMQQEASMPDWEHGSAAWKAARATVDGKRSGLWTQPNACDRDVLHSSAPLTVLFSLTAFWQEVKARRAHIDSTNKPLEIHVVGASYPFEGRSDWSLLTRHMPPQVPGIRVALVLGTPDQSDNVPPLDVLQRSITEANRNRHQKQPKEGKWSDAEQQILCKGRGTWGTRELDNDWSKAQLCRKHGNGLEVLCLEEYYEDAREKLARPDLVVLFSPGFPQLGRRSWDVELRWMLNDNVPILVSDLMVRSHWGRTVLQSGRLVPHGGHWEVGKNTYEDGEADMTFLTMQSYGARSLGAFRGPFPVLHAEDGGDLAKNAVVQMFRGYKPGQQPFAGPSTKEIAADRSFLDGTDFEALGVSEELKDSLYTSVSAAYSAACQEHYEPLLRDLVKEKGVTRLSPADRNQCEELGLCNNAEHQGGRQQPSRPWSAKDWIFIFKLFPPNNWV